MLHHTYILSYLFSAADSCPAYVHTQTHSKNERVPNKHAKAVVELTCL